MTQENRLLSELEEEFRYLEYFHKFSKYGNVLDFMKLTLAKHEYNVILNKMEMYANTLLREHKFDIKEKANEIFESDDINVTSTIELEKSYRYSKTIKKCQLNNIELLDEKNNCYIGEFKRDNIMIGKMISKSALCEGKFEAGKIVVGTIRFANGEVYEGTIRDYCLIKGRFFNADGTLKFEIEEKPNLITSAI